MVAHPIVLGGARPEGAQSPNATPLVRKLNEQAFMPFVLACLATAEGQRELGDLDAGRTVNQAGQMRLFQPIHRAFHVVLIEAFCDLPGLPRLDPQKILQAGICVRRVADSDRQAWVRDDSRILGWRSLDAIALGDAPVWDPEPEIREKERQGLNGAVLRYLASARPEPDRWQEDYAPLFAAPPEICERFGRTYLYGFLPVPSIERSEVDPRPAAPVTDDLVLERLPSFLRSERADLTLPPINRTLTPTHVKPP